MPTYLHEEQGVTLQVEYQYDADGVLNFGTIRALDDRYAATGPDLAPLLHTLYVVLSLDPPVAEAYLSTLVTEIEKSERH